MTLLSVWDVWDEWFHRFTSLSWWSCLLQTTGKSQWRNGLRTIHEQLSGLRRLVLHSYINRFSMVVLEFYKHSSLFFWQVQVVSLEMCQRPNGPNTKLWWSGRSVVKRIWAHFRTRCSQVMFKWKTHMCFGSHLKMRHFSICWGCSM